MGSNADRQGLSVAHLGRVAGIAIFLAIELGPIAVVIPRTTAYPVVAMLVRRFWMDERLSFQSFEMGMALLDAFLTNGNLFNAGPSRPRVFRPWRSFPTMVATGLVIGFATGGFPAYSREISQLALGLGMTFAMTEISFANISARTEFRRFVISLFASYGALSGLLLIFAAVSTDSGIHDGWVLMASVPPAIAVVPITSYLYGDTRRTVVSLAILYLVGLFLVPVITLAFTNQTVPLTDLVLQTILLIGLPMLASRPLRRWRKIADVRTSGVSISFFFLVIAIVGSTRGPLFARPELLVPLGLFSVIRTFGIGTAVVTFGRALHLPRDDQVALTAFASFKNLGLTVVLAFAVFGPIATLPSIVSLVCEILWLGSLPFVFRRGEKEMSATGQPG